jgi:hypothetical protein
MDGLTGYLRPTEVEAGAAGTRGGPRAAMSREVGARATGHVAAPELP